MSWKNALQSLLVWFSSSSKGFWNSQCLSVITLKRSLPPFPSQTAWATASSFWPCLHSHIKLHLARTLWSVPISKGPEGLPPVSVCPSSLSSVWPSAHIGFTTNSGTACPAGASTPCQSSHWLLTHTHSVGCHGAVTFSFKVLLVVHVCTWKILRSL